MWCSSASTGVHSAGPPGVLPIIGAMGGVHPLAPESGSSCKPRVRRLEADREEHAPLMPDREGVGGVCAVAGRFMSHMPARQQGGGEADDQFSPHRGFDSKRASDAACGESKKSCYGTIP